MNLVFNMNSYCQRLSSIKTSSKLSCSDAFSLGGLLARSALNIFPASTNYVLHAVHVDQTMSVLDIRSSDMQSTALGRTTVKPSLGMYDIFCSLYGLVIYCFYVQIHNVPSLLNDLYFLPSLK